MNVFLYSRAASLPLSFSLSRDASYPPTSIGIINSHRWEAIRAREKFYYRYDRARIDISLSLGYDLADIAARISLDSVYVNSGFPKDWTAPLRESLRLAPNSGESSIMHKIAIRARDALNKSPLSSFAHKGNPRRYRYLYYHKPGNSK